ncbi:MAG: glycosyltransferase family 2 protein, partial [SAR202 cluster bacterium]|nr:glycosyltransferase family 2 protein [SAR202 cluster bacterium]
HGKFGYGNAYLEGIKKARGLYVFLADSDTTYDFQEIPRFLKELDNGYDMIIGNRLTGNIEKGAMPFLHRYIGNPFLSFLLRLFFKIPIHDAHSGMRALKRNVFLNLNLRTTGMEFATEMIIKAGKQHLKIKELPISYYKRKGISKLRSFTDGWRHLRFMLLYSPLFLFFIPGLFLFLVGLSTLLWFYFGNPVIAGVPFFFHPMFISTLLVIIGYQIMGFAIFAKTFAITHLGEESLFMNKLHRHITIEKGSVIGIFITFLGLLIFGFMLTSWIRNGFGELNEIKNSILALTLIVVGIQTVFSSFMLSILGVKDV